MKRSAAPITPMEVDKYIDFPLPRFTRVQYVLWPIRGTQMCMAHVEFVYEAPGRPTFVVDRIGESVSSRSPEQFLACWIRGALKLNAKYENMSADDVEKLVLWNYGAFAFGGSW